MKLPELWTQIEAGHRFRRRSKSETVYRLDWRRRVIETGRPETEFSFGGVHLCADDWELVPDLVEFDRALCAIREGKSVAYESWEPGKYLYRHERRVMIRYPSRECYPYVFSPNELAEFTTPNWIILEAPANE